jgi:hypothetical protein
LNISAFIFFFFFCEASGPFLGCVMGSRDINYCVYAGISLQTLAVSTFSVQLRLTSHCAMEIGDAAVAVADPAVRQR